MGSVLEKIDWIVRRTSARSLFWAIIALDMLLLLLIFLVAVVPTQARFVAEGRTQFLSLQVPGGGRMPGWGDDLTPTNVFIPENCVSPAWSMPSYIEGPFSLRARTSNRGDLTITFVSDMGSSFGYLECEGGTRDLMGEFVVQWDAEDAKDLVLPISGQIVLGDDVTAGMHDQKLLLSGTIETHTIGRLGAAAVEGNGAELSRGDRVFFREEDGQSPLTYAIISVVDGAIDFSAQTQASEVQIVHYGQIESAAEVVSPGFLARLQAHSLWGLFALAGAIILHMFSALRDYVYERARGNEKGDPQGGGQVNPNKFL